MRLLIVAVLATFAVAELPAESVLPSVAPPPAVPPPAAASPEIGRAHV